MIINLICRRARHGQVGCKRYGIHLNNWFNNIDYCSIWQDLVRLQYIIWYMVYIMSLTTNTLASPIFEQLYIAVITNTCDNILLFQY